VELSLRLEQLSARLAEDCHPHAYDGQDGHVRPDSLDSRHL